MADPLMQAAPPQAAPMQSAPMQEAPEAAPSPDETDTFENMVAGLIEHMYGPAEAGILKQLKAAKNPAKEAGNITMLMVQEAASQAEAAGREFDMDMLLGVATEVIDSLLKMAQAAKVKIADEEDFRSEALFSAVQAYVASKPPGSEEQEAAKAMLAEMQANGMVDEGAAELQRLGQKHGVDPFAQKPPQQKPMAQAVRTGLMAGG
jgi:uncharacterized protein with beta-barrel porin domain